MKLVRGCCVLASSDRLKLSLTPLEVQPGTYFYGRVYLCLSFIPTFLSYLLIVCFLVCAGEDALPNGLDVTFEVTELKRLTGSYNTMVGNNEGSMVSACCLNLLLCQGFRSQLNSSQGTVQKITTPFQIIGHASKYKPSVQSNSAYYKFFGWKKASNLAVLIQCCTIEFYLHIG